MPISYHNNKDSMEFSISLHIPSFVPYKTHYQLFRAFYPLWDM